jgi:hypothetical protein
MPLDLDTTATQIDRMAGHIAGRRDDREAATRAALAILQALDPNTYEERRAEFAESQNRATVRFLQDPSSSFAPTAIPTDLTVAAVDGSHIDIDRHLAARCFLINIGVCTLTYGTDPDADLRSAPRLYASDDELVIRDDIGERSERIDGTILGALRHVEELSASAEVLETLPGDRPAVMLVDGPMTVAGLGGRVFPDFVLRTLITEGFAGAMERFRLVSANWLAAQGRALAVAGYTSLPGHDEVVRALSLALPDEDATQVQSPTDGVLDREVFGRLLPPGHRSALFASTGHPLESYQLGHTTVNFYLNTGDEIGRVELPAWAADEPGTVDLLHATLLDQCRRGGGYPTVLIEAHEQAVVNGRDRRTFVELVESALANRGVQTKTSEKNISKTVRRI